jgi:epoxyqueuosine reductase
MDAVGLSARILMKTREFGADDAGLCLASDLLSGPTHRHAPLPEGIEGSHSILVFGLSHPEDQPELDYYIKKTGLQFGNSEGNRRLRDISERVGTWIRKEGIASRDLHYYVERGGVYLKGAAVLAGLGSIGMNNLLIHPGYGARIRFRAHLVEACLTPSTPLDFSPCRSCDKPCLDICPAKALDLKGYHHDACQEYIDREAAETPILPADDSGPARREIRSCRICEYACAYQGTLEGG